VIIRTTDWRIFFSRSRVPDICCIQYLYFLARANRKISCMQSLFFFSPSRVPYISCINLDFFSRSRFALASAVHFTNSISISFRARSATVVFNVFFFVASHTFLDFNLYFFLAHSSPSRVPNIPGLVFNLEFFLARECRTFLVFIQSLFSFSHFSRIQSKFLYFFGAPE
jgi:hypothetical protein